MTTRDTHFESESEMERARLLSLYAEDARTLLHTLRTCGSDAQAMQSLHQLKGASGYLGAEAIVQICDQIRRLILEDPTVLPQHLDTLETTIGFFLERERSTRTEPGSTPG